MVTTLALAAALFAANAALAAVEEEARANYQADVADAKRLRSLPMRTMG